MLAPNQAEESFTALTLPARQQPSLVPRTPLPRVRADPQLRLCLSLLLAIVFLRDHRVAPPPAAVRAARSTVQTELLERSGSIAHGDTPAATGRMDTGPPGIQQCFQESRASEKDLQSKFQQQSSLVEAHLLPACHFQATI